MKYIEEHKDLFTVPTGYVLAHCISSDYVMGAGIAKQFTNRGVKKTLNEKYPEHKWEGKGYILPCIMNDSKSNMHTVVNLVTKEKVYHKPTYDTLKQSLIELRDYMLSRTYTYLAIPKIGCGLDGLDWPTVLNMICDIFKDDPITILVCDWP